ncbi:putative ATP-dependent helicase HRQ1 [Wickerhamomyces ciferrii]|uniref:ATP-dependent helicase HRQ1 n=1 Tax=Wickerhamomyces ciferrii (strain ATCC 14091 / BCRC 22168 / CBS 111 / JCM 3599 / NBRC 0793 / NRRL Y-1031 F-60-10) TaxID=1206466 RepID=K0KK54_WICCF|nr:putative ATP-dependent helicase HRQ1 [Wickerhamomyces ciferrii]CCH41513.1 putative ATP-dependent helicase HRQ1 [Wickerhamomyces ciferrii]
MEALKRKASGDGKKEGGAKKSKKIVRVEKGHWPPWAKELEQIHFRLNSYFTFLSSRKHIITKYDTLKQPVEKTIKRELTHEDVAKLVVLLPNDIVFKYVDENQVTMEKKEFEYSKGYTQHDIDMFKLKDLENSEQVLILEFIDGDLTKSKTQSAYYTEMKVPTYTPDSMKKMIAKRDSKFGVALNEFLQKCSLEGDDPLEKLSTMAQSKLPQTKEFIDPVEQMIKDRRSGEVSDERPTIPKLIENIKTTRYRDQITGSYVLPERDAIYKELDFELSENLKSSLGINGFYSHQAEALNAINKGENVIISTSTSSGKSLIYQIPVLDTLEHVPQATAMYIFPTKALAQDQKRSFQTLMNKMRLNALVDTYDGDTDASDRQHIKHNARVIFTNPDMVHTSILPNHQSWRHFLLHLRYVVIDELHIYKGLFGSHVALVMRRLRRMCAFLGNFDVQFISCSATLMDPVGHMHNIFGVDEKDITHIHEDGSPTGQKHLVVWNPPYINPNDLSSGRENFIKESANILVQLVLNNVRAIAFCYVRRVCELLMKEVRNKFQELNKPELVSQVMSYRGGYSASDRRQIEQEMFHGNLSAIISTNALELGIDIGGLDAVLMCGFPLSLSNFHQQSGRAGRRNKDSLTLVVGSDAPVDQHYMKHPELLLEWNFQELILDFENALVLEGHLQCAAFELPITDEDKYYFPNLEKVLSKLESDENGYHCATRYLPWPSKNVSIRGIEEDQYAVVDITNNRNIVIEEIEASRTSFTLYEGGIFIHQGYPYLVREFNADEHFAKVERVDVDWTTSQRDFTDVDPKEIELVRSVDGSDVPIYFGKILTTIVVFGFFKVDKNKRILDAIEVHNPPILIHSKGFWIDIPATALDLITYKGLNAAGGIHAAQHAIMGLLPLIIVSGVDEIHTECKAPEKEFAQRETKRKRPARLIFHDSKGGKHGSGLSIKAFEHAHILLEDALKRVLECPCDWGCPDCVAAAFCKENSLVLSKPAALIILYVILGKEFNLDDIPDGPEPNMPEIKVETIVSAGAPVKFARDVQIIDVRKAKEPLVKSEDKELTITGKERLTESNPKFESSIVKKEEEEEIGLDDLDDELLSKV